MSDPNDPRAAALRNITQSSRDYGRDRRRGGDASTDPAFRAALEMQDPEARRAALAEYARGRARDLFPQAPQAAPIPQAPDPEAAQVRGDANMFADVQRFGGDAGVKRYQNAPMVGDEDSPEQFRQRQNVGKEILAPTYSDQIDEANEARDTSRIEAFHDAPPNPAPDGISQIGDAVAQLQNRIVARRRR